jgi:hypothetical protein
MTQVVSPAAVSEAERYIGAVGHSAMGHARPVASTAPTAAIGVWPGGWSSDSLALDDILAYQRDLWERTILFWDTLRQRADNMIAHERAGKPPLLDFDYELILDARRSEPPVNYALENPASIPRGLPGVCSVEPG